MKLFLTISFSIHLALFSTASILIPGFERTPLPNLPLEVTLHSWKAEEGRVASPTKKDREETSPSSSPRVDVSNPTSPSENPVALNAAIADQRSEAREDPLSEDPSVLARDTSEEVREEVEGDGSGIALASLDSPPPLTREKEESSDSMPNPEALLIQSPKTQEVSESTPSPSQGPFPRPISELPPPSPSLETEIVIIKPKYAENPKPIYPLEARRKGMEGEVVLRVEVLPDGRVGHVEIKKSSGYEILDRSALSTVRRWKFIPAKFGERTISTWVNVPIKFQLQ